MSNEEMIHVFDQLGQRIEECLNGDSEALFFKMNQENPWFIESNIKLALQGIRKWLNAKVLESWLNGYNIDINSIKPKRVGLVLAGNIPFVGFHDVLCVLMSGNIAHTKFSSKDAIGMDFLRNELCLIDSRFADLWLKVDQLKDIDAIIATGSDNSARYFEYYFGKYPNIIRKNRTSIAIIDGSETEEDIIKLGKDVFDHFGLGCRNVTYLAFLKNADPIKLFPVWEQFDHLRQHNKYRNNYEYYRSIYLVNAQDHLVSDFLLMKEDTALFTPIANMNYGHFASESELAEFIKANAESIQCIVGARNSALANVEFGLSQSPDIDDYADGVDTMEYLISLSR